MIRLIDYKAYISEKCARMMELKQSDGADAVCRSTQEAGKIPCGRNQSSDRRRRL